MVGYKTKSVMVLSPESTMLGFVPSEDRKLLLPRFIENFVKFFDV